MWLQSLNIKTTHGFSTRYGGVSEEPFHSLNLGGIDDSEENIAENRKRALGALGINMNQVSYLNQIHSNQVCYGKLGKQTGDALVTNNPNICLAIGAADCYPILFHDQKNGVIGAAHCGWKGTLAKIVKNTIEEMTLLGANIENIQMAIGQGISIINYEVSNDVISQFVSAGFTNNCWLENKLNLLEANKEVALQCGVLDKNIWSMNRCTTESDFFSYRRDKGITGRMWGVIML